ncbi:hypothetical protein WA026_021722 [Henosepilachna vigintioctopunctata]|uniref:Uncharacterized protein n=1 Tax=Henosepilachna vigintioctopunctata TaxID=420089 RepID=A0AAW1TZB6_9CUCU
MDAVLYLSTNCLSFRGCHETPSDLITQYPQPSQGVHSASSCQEAINPTNLKGSSQMRWSAKHGAVNVLLNNSPEIAEASEEVKQTFRAPEAKYEAGHLLTAITNFKFFLYLTIWTNILREIYRVNIEIQKEDIILARSVELMEGLLKT